MYERALSLESNLLLIVAVVFNGDLPAYKQNMKHVKCLSALNGYVNGYLYL